MINYFYCLSGSQLTNIFYIHIALLDVEHDCCLQHIFLKGSCLQHIGVGIKAISIDISLLIFMQQWCRLAGPL
jgi:hypothetical protein